MKAEKEITIEAIRWAFETFGRVGAERMDITIYVPPEERGDTPLGVLFWPPVPEQKA